MNWLVVLFGVLAAIAWIGAVASWMSAIKRRKKGVRLSHMLTSGMAAFDKNNYREEGLPYRRRMAIYFVAFFVCLFGAAGFGIAHAALSGDDNPPQTPPDTAPAEPPSTPEASEPTTMSPSEMRQAR